MSLVCQCSGKDIMGASIGQMEPFPQFSHIEREIAYGDIGLLDGLQTCFQFAFVHGGYSLYAELPSWEGDAAGKVLELLRK